ncbi:MAG: hypothetical protein DDT22_00210 [candidate division WS2 bacterium]|nr:hypothetical protein [Candidatus Lithacetigena glycinireducens]MBT9174550.1 hypothetical protein [Candidatus Lithacetigena glycinireducens]
MVDNWVLIVFVGIPLWIMLIVFLSSTFILTKKIDKISRELSYFVENEGKELIREGKGLLRDSRVILNKVRVSTHLLPQVTGALYFLSTMKMVVDISKKVSSIIKKKGG